MTNNQLKMIVTAIIALLVIMALSFSAGWMMASKEDSSTIVRDTVIKKVPVFYTKVERDTLIKADTVVKTVKVCVPQSAERITDSVFIVDSVQVELPYEHRIYEVPDTLKVWYSGVDPSVDSVMMFQRTETITERVQCDTRKNLIMMQAGIDEASVIYSRRIGRLSLGIGAGCTYKGKATASVNLGLYF